MKTLAHRGAAAAALSLLVLLPAATGVRAQDSTAAARLHTIAQSYATRGQFSGSVLVARGEQVLLDRGYGLASQEWQVPNTPTTRHLLASVSKQFTAAAVLRLVDQRKLRLDDPVAQHLPELPAAWRGITVRQILAHTSGIANHTDGEALERIRHRTMTPQALLAQFRDAPLDFQPGSDWRYSNSGYILAGLLVEALSGQAFGEFVKAELLTPLGMADTALAQSGTVVPRLASGYTQAGSTLRTATHLDLSVPWAAGGLYGTTQDLLKWHTGLYGGRVLSPASLQAMTTPVQKNYGLGLGVQTRDGRLRYSHSGGISGFSTFLLYEPAQRLTVVVLSNLESAASERLANQLGQAANGVPVVLPEERQAVSVPPTALARLAGSYGSTEPGPLWLTLRGDTLWARMARQHWVKLVPLAGNRFWAPDVDGELQVELAADGSATAVTVPDLPGSPRWARSAVPLPTLAAQPVFLRGSMNRWSTEHRMSAGADGVHRVAIDLAAGAHEFKVASADWATIDLGGGGAQTAPLRQGGGSVLLAGQGRNIGLQLERASRCEFSVDGRELIEPRLVVACGVR